MKSGNLLGYGLHFVARQPRRRSGSDGRGVGGNLQLRADQHHAAKVHGNGYDPQDRDNRYARHHHHRSLAGHCPLVETSSD